MAAAEHLSSETPASSANSSACTRSKHVVLASFGEPEAYHTVSLYFASKFPDTAVHHLWLHLGQDKAEETSNHSVHRKKTATDWRMFYQSHGIHRSVVDMSSIDDYHRFRKDYVHSSVNGYEYELLCFARFIGLRDFCTSKGIDQLTWIDADIPIFDSNFLDKVCLPRGYSTWALTSGSSFLNTMTCSDIGRFAEFMLDFYARENRHALARAINAHGSNDLVDRGSLNVVEQIRREEPAFAELGIDPKHFNDMFLFSKFLQDTNAKVTAVAPATREEDKEKDKSVSHALSAHHTAPRLHKAYIHQEENGGTIDPYFLPIMNIHSVTSHPEKERLCESDALWSQHYRLSRSDDYDVNNAVDGYVDGSDKSSSAKHDKRLGLSLNQNDTWVPIAGAHFQGMTCKERLLDMFYTHTLNAS